MSEGKGGSKGRFNVGYSLAKVGQQGEKGGSTIEGSTGKVQKESTVMAQVLKRVCKES